jgi:hypothetical protein
MILFANQTCGLCVAIGLMLAPSAIFAVDSTPQPKEPALGAVRRMSQPGPQEAFLAAQTGTWDVIATLWPSPDARPKVMRGLVAVRKMIGAYLQELLQPAPGSKNPDFQRIDYLNFDHVEGRWKYVSMDTRFPVSIMPAAGSGLSGTREPIVVQFVAQAFVGFGDDVEGRFMTSDMSISSPDPDHVIKEQRVSMANGSGDSWLFVRYEYVRRK